MQLMNGIIIGGAAAAIGTIIANRFFNGPPAGGGQPMQVNTGNYTARGGTIRVRTPTRNPNNAAPVVQNTPITEAAYNQHPTSYEPTLGPDRHRPSDELTLPV